MIEGGVPILLNNSGTTKSSTVGGQSKRRAAAEVLVIYGLVLLVFWTPPPLQDLLWVVTGGAILAVLLGSFDGLEPMGLGKVNLAGSLWAVAVSLAMAAIAVILAGRLHTLHVPDTNTIFLRKSCLYVLWACIQQLVLQCFFLSRLLRMLGDATGAAAAAAMLFAIAHLPSPILTLITLVGGLASCLFFLRYRSLCPLVVAHIILGIAIAVTVPSPMDHNMQVGLGYLTWADHAKPTRPAPLQPQ